MESNNSAEIICKTIVEQLTEFITGKILEIGPLDGRFTEQFLQYTNNISVVEYDSGLCNVLREKFLGNITIYEEDAHLFLSRTNTHYDTVVLFGFLYHSHAPLAIVEDMVNNISPKYILLETWDMNCPVAIKEELINITGWRWAHKKHCGLSITINDFYYEKALDILGYRLIKKFRSEDLIECASFKKGGIYMVFEK
jgi:hypothetical protein